MSWDPSELESLARRALADGEAAARLRDSAVRVVAVLAAEPLGVLVGAGPAELRYARVVGATARFAELAAPAALGWRREGETLLAWFDDRTAALAAALQAQLVEQAHALFGFGLGYGPCVVAPGGDVQGEPAHGARRIARAVKAGEIGLTTDAAEQLGLPDGVGLHRAGVLLEARVGFPLCVLRDYRAAR